MLDDKQISVLGDLEVIAIRTRQIFDKKIYVVGTVSQLLAGIEVTPRDIDILVGEGIERGEFEEKVLHKIGYVDIGDFCFSLPNHEGTNLAQLNLSHPNYWTDSNIFAAAPENSFGWSFEDKLWTEISLPSFKVNIPNPSLSLFLKLKSVSDKIFLSGKTDSTNSQFWRELLLNDIKCLSKELIFQKKYYYFEDILTIFNLIPSNSVVIGQLIKAADFSISALSNFSAAAAGFLLDIANIIRTRLKIIIETASTSRSEGIKSDDFPLLFEDDNVRVFSDLATGAIYAETQDQFDFDGWVPSRPMLADIQLNSTCNMKCSHCEYDMPGGNLNLSVFKKKIEDLRSIGVVQLNFGEASEVLLYDNLPSALVAVSEAGMIANLTTNLSIEPSEQLWTSIIKHCGAVAVSIDQFHFPKLMNINKYWPISRRITRLIDNGVRVIINTVYDHEDIDGLSNILEIALSLRCHSVCIIRRFYNKGNTYRKIHASEFSKIISTITKPEFSEIVIGFHSSDPISKILDTDRISTNLTPMTEARHTIFLDSEGRYRPSSFSPPELDIWCTAKDAWNSESFKDFRKNTSDGMLLT